VKIDISPGELFDRLTILEIKLARIPDKRAVLGPEYTALAAERTTLKAEGLDRLVAELMAVNTTLWEVEDGLRDHERRRDFGPSFVELARSVYFNNDRRSAIKRQINMLLGSTLTEEKSYPSY
jgi:hypothetical protein